MSPMMVAQKMITRICEAIPKYLGHLGKVSGWLDSEEPFSWPMKFGEVWVECVLSVVFAIMTREGKENGQDRKSKESRKRTIRKRLVRISTRLEEKYRFKLGSPWLLL